MSSIGWVSTGDKCVLAIALFVLVTPATVYAQAAAKAPATIDILASKPEGALDQRKVEECKRQEDAAQISGEIVVCREILEDTDNYYSGSREDAQNRYAQETMYKDAPPTPNPCGPMCGIFEGEPSVGKLCIPGLQKCPPPPALLIDVTALPQAPPGSDADRISRGLPPIGNDKGTDRGNPLQDQLGLPPALEAEPKVSPAISEEPAEEP